MQVTRGAQVFLSSSFLTLYHTGGSKFWKAAPDGIGQYFIIFKSLLPLFIRHGKLTLPPEILVCAPKVECSLG